MTAAINYWEMPPEQFKQYLLLKRLRARQWLVGVGSILLVALVFVLLWFMRDSPALTGLVTLLVNAVVGVVTTVVNQPLSNGSAQ
jgi:hypothetical protein